MTSNHGSSNQDSSKQSSSGEIQSSNAGLAHPKNSHLKNSEIELDERFDAITENYLSDEKTVIELLLPSYENESSLEKKAITSMAISLIDELLSQSDEGASLENFLTEYSLDTREGLQLMSLAEALVRIPDAKTAEALIESKLRGADWIHHLDKSLSPLVNVTTRALLFSNYILNSSENSGWLHKLSKKLGEPVIREALITGMKLFGKQFVLGENLKDALSHAAKQSQVLGKHNEYTFSFDMLGEAALSRDEADRYFNAYKNAIEFFANDKPMSWRDSPSISIKLSALHPRYEGHQEKRVLRELGPRLKELVVLAKNSNVNITIDAEESERLELSLKVFEQVFAAEELKDWGYFGLALQAYSKRAYFVLRWLKQLSAVYHKKIPVRLVKGAYWDREIKFAQVMGLANYPVFTHKSATDICYLACAHYLIERADYFYPQFATHNAVTVATILGWTTNKKLDFEFQRLHGMGKALYDFLLARDPGLNCRIYAPIGAHNELLPYLIRRLLENGSNNSFINQVAQKEVSVEELAMPAQTLWLREKQTQAIPLPAEIYGSNRRNSFGICTHTQLHRNNVLNTLEIWQQIKWHCQPLVHSEHLISNQESNQEPDESDSDTFRQASKTTAKSPFNSNATIGTLYFADSHTVDIAVKAAADARESWQNTPVEIRCGLLSQLADALEKQSDELLSLLVREAGKNIDDSLAEIREAVDFCRYYSAQALPLFQTVKLPGPTGEDNKLYYQPRGVIACISPWNFPLAIFIGQISAALATGNCVIAKPAEQTSLIAYRVVEMMYELDFPTDVIQLLPGLGESIGDAIIKHPLIAGVVFTGSFATAQLINRRLAERPGPMVPLIAETGGQNVMIVDSSALPEQVVQDVLQSAFGSAGQRCSALRVLYLQESLADKIIRLLAGAVKELKVGPPGLLETDIGPVIDNNAAEKLNQHINWLVQNAKYIVSADLDAETQQQILRGEAFYVAPCVYEIERLDQIKEENFGPILHIIRYKPEQLDDIIQQINASGYGLTFGIHSRNQDTIEIIQHKIRAGNIYVNRNMIGAVVGVQPFGGMGLSGTGPKAGGPNYLQRFVVEKVLTDNTSAIGGNVQLLIKH